MATSALQSRAQHCKSKNCAFSPFIDIFCQHCKIAIIHPQQPLRHCRAPCQGCNAADSDLWYNLPDVFDEAVATQCAARMVIGTFTASSFFHNAVTASESFKELTKIYEDEINTKIQLIESLGTDQFISHFVESELEMRKIEMDKMLKIKDLLKDRFKLYFENYILQH